MFKIVFKNIVVVLMVSITFVSAFASSVKNGSELSAQDLMVFKKLDVAIQAEWTNGPFTNQKDSTLTVYLYNTDGELIDLPEGYNFKFFAVMPSMGHPMKTAGSFSQIELGVYQNTGISFQMPGDWQFEVSIIDENNKVLDKVTWTDFL